MISAGVAALAITGGIGAGIAAADTPTPAPTPTATASATPGNQANGNTANHMARRSLLIRALHAEATLGGKFHRVVDFQRGTVEKVSTTSITVKSIDGFTATYVVDPQTKVRKNQAKAELSAVKAQDKVRIRGVKNGSTVTATVIRDHGTG
jgi:Domain of unknown function (DUF5666)